MEADKTSSRLKKSKKKADKNESSKTEVEELDSLIDPNRVKKETLSDEEVEHTWGNLKRVLDTETPRSEDAQTSKRNRTETDVSERIGMPMNAPITCENPRPVSVVHKTEINQYPVFIVQKLQSDEALGTGSPIVKIVSSDSVEKTLKMSPSSLSRPKTSRRPFARKILPATLKMDTNDMTSASVSVTEYKEKKQKKAKMLVKRVSLKKKKEDLTKKHLQQHFDIPVAEDSPCSLVASNDSVIETSPVSLNNPKAVSTENVEVDRPRPVFLFQNKSFARNKKQMYKMKNHQSSVNQDTAPPFMNEAALTSDPEFQNVVKSIKKEPVEIQSEMSEPIWTGTERQKDGEPCLQYKKGFETNNDKDVNSDSAELHSKFSKQVLKSGAATQFHHSHSQPKSIFPKPLNMSVEPSVPEDTSKSNLNNSLTTNPEYTVSTFSPSNVSSASSKSIYNLPLGSKDIAQCLRNSGTDSTNNIGPSLSPAQGTVLATQCQSTTGMKLVTIPQETITSIGKKSGSRNLNSSSPTLLPVPSRPAATTELVSSPLIRSTQLNNVMFPRIPNNVPGLRYPAPFIIPQPASNIIGAPNTASPSQQILSSVTNTGAAISSQNLLINPPSLPQGPGILNNSMFEQSLGGYRLGNIIIKTQNIPSGTLPQTSAVSSTLSPAVNSSPVPSAQNPNQIIQGTSIQSMPSQVPTSVEASGTIPSATIQGTTPTGNTSSPLFSYHLPQVQGIKQNQILCSPLVNFPFFSQQPGTIVNPGSNQGLIQNPKIQTFNQQVPGAEPQLRVQEVKHQVPQEIPNLIIPGAKQKVPQAFPSPSVQGSKLMQSSAGPQMIVIGPNLPNHSTTQIQSTGSPQLSYSQMLQLLGNIPNPAPVPGISLNQSNPPNSSLHLQTHLVSSTSAIPNLNKPTSVSSQPAVLTSGADDPKENQSSSKALSISAINSQSQNIGKTSSVTTIANRKKDQSIADSGLQSSEFKAQEVSVDCEKGKSVTVSASESSPASASPVVPAIPTASLKEIPLKLGSEMKPIPSDIPGPFKAYDHDVLIHVKYKYRRSRNKTRSMYIHDPIWRSMIKGYIRRELNYRHLAKQLYQIPELVKELHKLFLKQIETECGVMCSSKTQTILRKLDPPDLETLKIERVLTELQTDAPLLRSVLDAVRSEKCPDQNLGIVAALLLYSRSTFLSAVHHVITKILHKSGADTKTIDLLSSMGLCSKSTSYFSNIKRYNARNNIEECQNTINDAQQCSDDNLDTAMDVSDENLSSEEDFDIKSKLKDKILKKISPENKNLKRKRVKNTSKMKNIQSNTLSKKFKISSPLKGAKTARNCDNDTLLMSSNCQGTSSKTDKFKTAESCNESDVPLISAANDNNSAINSFCDNVEIHDSFEIASDSDLNEATAIPSSSKG